MFEEYTTIILNFDKLKSKKQTLTDVFYIYKIHFQLYYLSNELNLRKLQNEISKQGCQIQFLNKDYEIF